MKAIMFRGIGINEGTFFYSMTISNGTIKRKMNCVFLEVNGKWIGVKPETLGQFTGLCDKNGKEIFEGDIYFDEGISYWGSHCVGPYKNYRVVEYNTERAQFVARHHCGYENIDTTKEIMGNIHENSELLK